jgi:hypothetical protein
VESVAGRTFAQPPRPNVLTGAAGCEAFIRGFSDEIIVGMLGPNPTQEHFRLAIYYLTDLAFQASGDEPLAWGEFMGRYTAMYPRGQPGLPDDPVTAYIKNLRATSAAPRSTTTPRARTTRRHDPTRECNVCVASTSRSSESELAPRHHAADAQRRVRLDELAEARLQLDEELALLHQELAWMPSLATGGLHNTSPCRRSTMRGVETGVSAVWLVISRTAAHQRRRRAGRHVTTTDAPTRETHRHSSGERRRTFEE